MSISGVSRTDIADCGARCGVSCSVEVAVPLSSGGKDEEGSPKRDEGYCSPVFRTTSLTATSFHRSLSSTFSMDNEMTGPGSPKKYQIYKLVLTGGPCGGKTTGQDRVATFFENMGWKVFTVPETATILQSGRVKFAELSEHQAYLFQRDLLKTMLQIEDTYFNQAAAIHNKNVLVICDRGAMDPSAYMDRKGWEKILKELSISEFDLLNQRYNQVIHLVTAADGAEGFYTLANNSTRKESVEQARVVDDKTRKVWVGHPYLDIVDNTDCSSFEDKVLKVVQVVCDRTGVESQDRLSKNSKKRKWLVKSFDKSRLVKHQLFTMDHDYLLADTPALQVRIRKRSQGFNKTFTLTTRVWHADTKECVETRMPISEREYVRYLSMRDKSRACLKKHRYCFMVGNQYFNLDCFVEKPPSADIDPLFFLETYTTVPKGTPLPIMPDFLGIEKEITGDSSFSMYSLSKIPGIQCERAEFLGAAKYRDD